MFNTGTPEPPVIEYVPARMYTVAPALTESWAFWGVAHGFPMLPSPVVSLPAVET